MLYAYVLCKLFNIDLTKLICNTLAKRAERLGEQYLGYGLYKQSKNKYNLGLYCAHTHAQGNKEKSVLLYEQNGLLSFNQYDSEGEKYLTEQNFAKAVYNFVLAKNVEKAAFIALKFAKGTYISITVTLTIIINRLF